MATMVETHDLLPVRSRVNWGAIVAGAVVALAVYLLFSVLGVAMGLSASHWVGAKEIGIGAAAWAVFSVLISLFLGGWVSTQCTAGENKMESILYGLLVWAVVFGAMLWLTATGVRMGFNGILGLANAPAGAAAIQLSDEDLRTAGFTDEQIQNMRGQFDRLRQRDVSGDARSIAADPRTTAAAWWTFGGIALSVLASVGGAFAGAGPNLVLTALRVRATSAPATYTTRESVNR